MTAEPCHLSRRASSHWAPDLAADTEARAEALPTLRATSRPFDMRRPSPPMLHQPGGDPIDHAGYRGPRD